jgi:hypothetical protein
VGIEERRVREGDKGDFGKGIGEIHMNEQVRPQKSDGDFAHALIKAGISQIPIIGAPAAEIFKLIITPPIEKRRDDWIESIGNGLKQLAEKYKDFSIESLSQNESFVTTLIHASEEAIKNHQNEKKEALKNAVLNAALVNAPNQDFQLIFLDHIDSFTAWHLTILKFIDDPKEWVHQNNVVLPIYMMGSIGQIIEDVFPALKGKHEFYDILWKSLFSNGLITTDSTHGSMTREGMFSSRTTDTGKQFIRFITSPL